MKQGVSDGGSRWTVPKLTRDFEVDAAWQRAIEKASEHMNKILRIDDMTIQLEQKGSEMVGIVKDTDSGKVMQEYEAAQVIRLYAHNMQACGLVVDGRV